jgi:hypothetical protein
MLPDLQVEAMVKLNFQGKKVVRLQHHVEAQRMRARIVDQCTLLPAAISRSPVAAIIIWLSDDFFI